MECLVRLNFSQDNDSIAAFSQIENYMFKTQPRLNTEFIRKFMRDNTEVKGLFEIIFQRKEGDPHFLCCYSLKLLVMLLDRSLHRHADFFLKLFVSLPPSKLINGYKLGSHLEAKGLPKCKAYAYELLRTYRANNPTSQFHLTSVFSCNKELDKYELWEKSQLICSINSEHYGEFLPANQDSLASHDKETDDFIIEEPVHRNRSMAGLQLSIGLRRQNKAKKTFPMSTEQLYKFKQQIDSQDLASVADDNAKGSYSSLDRGVRSRFFKSRDNLQSYIEPELGRSFIKLSFGKESPYKLKLFYLKDLVKTALEINKRDCEHKGKREFFLRMASDDNQQYRLQIFYQELCNLKTKLFYLVSSYYDFFKNKKTVVDDHDDESVTEVCFIGKVEIELAENRLVNSIAFYCLSSNELSARLLCNEDNLREALHQGLSHFFIQGKDGVPEPNQL